VSKHSWPSGAADPGKETTDVPVDTDITDAPEAQPTSQAADELVEDADEATEPAEESTTADAGEEAEPAVTKRRVDWPRVVAFGVLPAVALLLAMAAGFLKWQDDSMRDGDLNAGESPAHQSIQAAKDSTIAMLSYKPDTVEKQLNDARALLTGEFRDSYTSLINDVVIPGAKEKQISAVASVPAAASVSAEPTKAVVLVFVNQTVVVGQDTPSDTASSVRVTMEKVGDRWLISEFEPV
jgi:Mce-associated membrane protein